MQSNQDPKRFKEDFSPFSLEELNQPIPPRRRPVLKPHPVRWFTAAVLMLALLGGISYGG